MKTKASTINWIGVNMLLVSAVAWLTSTPPALAGEPCETGKYVACEDGCLQSEAPFQCCNTFTASCCQRICQRVMCPAYCGGSGEWVMTYGTGLRWREVACYPDGICHWEYT